MKIHMGLDVGSTTVKLVIINENYEILFQEYTRHRSDIEETTKNVLRQAYDSHPEFKNSDCTIMVTGSGGMYVEDNLNIEFIQEVVAGTTAIKIYP